ncbi:hypothetical protein C0989_000283 [Termitomyces sp. Mn162]|nr:hypothetical protein C0989_000283 [Termitomyces sp. Mn162]
MPPIRKHLPSPAKSNKSGKDKIPPPTDPATWRESLIPPGEMITSSQAYKWYQIKHLDVLNEIEWEPFMSLTHNVQRPITRVTLVASHRKIERKAWEKHGGPERWDTRIRRKIQWNKQVKGTRPYPEPIIGKLSDNQAVAKLQLEGKIPPDGQSPTDLLLSKYVTSTNLRQLYQEFILRFSVPWVWEKCNSILDAAGVFADAAREIHLGNALVMLPLYPLRTGRRQLRASGSLRRRMADVLRRAPRKGDSNMDVIKHPSGQILHVWSKAYLTELYEILKKIFDRCGMEVWKKVRFNVYHTQYDRCHGSMHFNSYDGTWSDPAFQWLAGKAEPGSFIHSERSRCQAGIEYNEVLSEEDA